MTSTRKTPNNRSVIYSFQGRWEQLLRSGDIRVFFRKRRPIRLPERVFIYVGVPVKAVIGFAAVESIFEVSLSQAKAMASEGRISAFELEKYIGHEGAAHAIRIDEVVLFENPRTLSHLNQNFGFNPPQSFSIVDASLEGALLGSAK